MAFLRALFSPLGRWLAAAAAAVALVFTMRARGYADGKRRTSSARRLAEKGLREAREIERRVRYTPEDERVEVIRAAALALALAGCATGGARLRPGGADPADARGRGRNDARRSPRRRRAQQNRCRALRLEASAIGDVITPMLGGVVPAIALGALVWHLSAKVTRLETTVDASAAEAGKAREEAAKLQADVHAIKLDAARDGERWRAVVERLDGMQGLLQSITSSIAVRPAPVPRQRRGSPN